MNTIKGDPAKGLSKLQRAILSWLKEEGHPASGWVRGSRRPASLKCMVYHDEKGYFYSGPSDPSFSRALASLKKRGLVEQQQISQHTSNYAVVLRLTEQSKLITTGSYQFSLPLEIKRLTESKETGGATT